MNINLHIERLVLDELTVPSRDAAVVSAALQSELSRLLATGALTFAPGVAVPSMRTAPLTLSPGAGAEAVGYGVAQAIYGGLTRT